MITMSQFLTGENGSVYTSRLQKICINRVLEYPKICNHLFRDDLNSKHLESDPQFYFEELETTIGLLHEINEVLLNIFEQQKKDFRASLITQRAASGEKIFRRPACGR